MAITPLVYPPWQRLGLEIDQYVEIELAEEWMAQFPLADAVEEAYIRLCIERLPEPSSEIMRAAVWDCRRTRQRVSREVKQHLRGCHGCEECLPPEPVPGFEEEDREWNRETNRLIKSVLGSCSY